MTYSKLKFFLIYILYCTAYVLVELIILAGLLKIKLILFLTMSYRVRDITSIHNSVLNNSISKQQYSIPKAERFKNNKTESSYKYYELPSTNARKAPTFGHELRKSIVSGDNNIPSPDKYFLNTIYPIKFDSRQITFAKGREVTIL